MIVHHRGVSPQWKYQRCTRRCPGCGSGSRSLSSTHLPTRSQRTVFVKNAQRGTRWELLNGPAQ
jgi:hypothetical protein